MSLIMAAPSAKRRVQNAVITGAANDPYWANVVLLLGCKGTNGSTSFPDSSIPAHTMTPFGTAQISTAQFKFPPSSGAFLGTGYLNTPDSVDWHLPGDFTIECWYRPSSIGTRQLLLGQCNSAGSDYRNVLEINAAGRLTFHSVIAGVAGTLTGVTTLSAGTWYFLTVLRSGNLYTVCLNGASEASAVNGGVVTDFAGTFSVGRCGDFTTLLTNGYLEQVRITKGVARYTAPFTPPVAPFPTS